MDCTHWWLLDFTPAVCKHCGETREFKGPRYDFNAPTSEAAYELRHAIRSSKRYPVDR